MDFAVSCYTAILKDGRRLPLVHCTLDGRYVVGPPGATQLVPVSAIQSIRSAGCRKCDMSWGAAW
jgi:hypothetical protein